MTLSLFTAAIATKRDRISASELTEGDTVLHLGSPILVVSEPKYTQQGIVFDAQCLDVDTLDNIQFVCFQPEELKNLVSHTPLYIRRLHSARSLLKPVPLAK